VVLEDLLRILAGETQATLGELRFGHHVTIGYGPVQFAFGSSEVRVGRDHSGR